MSQTTTNRRIAAASFIIMAAVFFGHVISLVKEMIVARSFGLGLAIDSFYAALTAPNFINNIVLSAFSILFIPVYVSYRKKNADEANEAASVVINTLGLALAVITLALYLGAGAVTSVLFSGFPAETINETARYLRILSLTVFLTGIVGAFTSILNSCERFLAPALSSILVTLSIMGFILFGKNGLGGSVLAVGQAAGILLQLLFLYAFVTRTGYRHRFVFNLRHPAVSEMLGSTLSFLGITVLWSVSPVVNRTMASWLPAGSIAAMSYADKLIQAPLVIFLSSVVTAIYPYFARQIADDHTAELKDTFISSLKLSAFIMVPLTAAFIVYAYPLISLLFQRGAFNAAATGLTATLLAVFSVQFLFYAPMAITMRLLMALRRYRGIMAVFAVSIALNAGLNYVFMKTIDPPAAGIALATVINICFLGMAFYVMARRLLGPLSGRSIAATYARAALLAAPAGLTMNYLYAAMAGSGGGPRQMIMALAVSGSAGIFVYVSLAWILRMDEFVRILRLAQRRFASPRS